MSKINASTNNTIIVFIASYSYIESMLTFPAE